MENQVYLIKHSYDASKSAFYAEHGEIGGMPDAIGYDQAAHARKFRTEEAAWEYIKTVFPAWGREIHNPVSMNAGDFIWGAIELSIHLRSGLFIPDRLLEPTAGRLRIWRR